MKILSRCSLPFAVGVTALLSTVHSARADFVQYSVDKNAAFTSAAAVTASHLPAGVSSSATLVGYADRTSNSQSGMTDPAFYWSNLPETLDTSKYIQFSITSAQSFSLLEFSFMPRNFWDKPGKIEVRFSTSSEDFDSNYVVLYSSNERYTQPTTTYGTDANGTPIIIDLTASGVPATISSGYFRIYVYDVVNRTNGAASPSSWVGVDDVTILFTSTIPEPGTAGLFVGGGVLIAVGATHRRR